VGGGAEVLRVAADREEPGVELAVERLDAAVHDLREAREVVDRAHLDARGGQLACGAARRDELDPEVGEAAGELHDAALVRDGDQRPADPHLAGLDGRALLAVGSRGDGVEDIDRARAHLHASRGGSAALALPGVIDLHFHALPGIDDGPPDLESAVALARTAAGTGATAVVATPHVSWEYPNTARQIADGVRRLNA